MQADGGPVAGRSAQIHRRTQAFLRGRTARVSLQANAPQPAEALLAARTRHLALAASQGAASQAVSLTTPWTAVGPVQIQTTAYGLVTGRVTAVAIDPSDSTGNTVYVGTTGGGVWKSTNAAGPAAAVSFAPLTDTLSVFSANAGGSVVPSLSIGAVSVQPGGSGVVLAGTGDPNDASDSYYGSGLLRSADSGATWSLVTGSNGASFVGEGFAGFAWSTTSANVVVAAVSSAAESALVAHSRSPGVRGLWVSQDAGATWSVATLQDGSTVVQSQSTDYSSFRGNAATSVVWNPIRKKFYAAVRSHGYYESVDGVTWTRLAAQPGTGLTAANCPTRTGSYGLTSCPIFRGALAVQPVSGDLFALTVDATNRDQGLFQDACLPSGTGCTSSAVQWGTRLDATPMETAGVIDSGDYNLVLAAVPAATALAVNDTLLFAGTGDLFRCGLSGGCTLRNTTNTENGCAAPAGVAPAQHAIDWEINASNTSTPRLFLGNDGGLWRSLDGVKQQAAVCSADDATHFENLNGALGSLAEVSGFSSHPGDASILLAALGGNGSAASTTAAQATGGSAWTQMSSGESGSVAIDQSNGNTWLVQSGAGVNLHACTSGSACTAADFSGPAAIGSAQVQGDSSLVDAPALLDPAWNTNVLTGTCRVFRGPASGGTAWSSSSAISRFFAGPSGSACNSSNAFLRSLAAGGSAVTTNGSQNSGSLVLYAGLAGLQDGGSNSGGHLFVTTSANTATSSTVWTDVTSSPVSNGNGTGFNAGGFDVSSIGVDPSDSSGRTVYATVMGFGVPHLYQSTDAGATWLNITANLPDAPANSVVVDPNNPRIVYVALDTGVYVASDVTTCVNAATGVSGSCWGVLGTALPNAPVVTLSASRGITVNGSIGMLRAGTYGRGIWQTPLLSAGQALLPVATFSPASLTFGSQNVGSTGSPQTVMLTNTGNTVLQISTVSASAGFQETDTCAGTSLTVNATCTLSVSFAPTVPGSLSGTLTVHGSMSGGYATLPLSGTGQGVASLVLSPASISFATTQVGATSAPQTVTVTNSGTGDAALSSPSASADFSVASTTCGATLAAGSNCTVSVVFTPSQSALEIGSMSLSDADGTYTVSLSGRGTGAASVSLTPSAIDFGAYPVGGYGGLATVTVTNHGNGTATLAAPAVTGDFSVYSNGCDPLLGAGATCQIQVAFWAASTGQRTGTLTMTASGVTQTVQLSGSGYAASVSFLPAALTFGTVNVGSASTAQAVTVSNTGSTTLTWGVLAAAGDFSTASNTCVGSLAPGGTCGFSVLFVPTLDGPRTGTVSLPDGTGTHILALSGTGRGAALLGLSPATDSFGSVPVFTSSSAHSFLLTNSGTATATLNPPATTGDFLLTATTCGSSLAPAANCTLSVVFSPQSDGARTGTLTLTGSAGSQVAQLLGTGTGTPLVTLTPASLTFSATAVHGTSVAQTITVRNSGTASTTLGTPSVTGDFALASSTCGSSLALGATCSLSIAFTPLAEGARSGVLSLNDGTTIHSVALSGPGVAGDLSLSPTSLTFPDTSLNTTSAGRSLTLTNSGTGALTLTSLSVGGDFAFSGTCAGTTLAVGQSCSVTVTFTPTAIGARPGTLTVASNSGGTAGSTVVTLGGNGKGAVSIVLTPSSVDFGTQLTGIASAVRNVTISNTGTATGGLGSITAGGDFSVRANTCGTSLPPQTGCTVSVVFTPTAGGQRSGTLTVVDDAGTQTASLTGIGTAAATDTLSTSSLTFASQQVNTVSAVQAVTLTNSGDAALMLISAQVLTGDFTAANGCGPTLPAHSSCAVSVAFTPHGTGALTGTLQITDVQRNQLVMLNGIGTAGPGVSLTPSILAFANTGVGVSTAGQTLTLVNNGGVPLSLTAITLMGDFGIVAGSSTCSLSAPVPVGGSCSLQVAFLPTGAGLRTGSVTITSNAATQAAQLSGTGVDFQFLANGATTVTTSSGGSAVFPLLLRPLANTSDTVSFACAGAPTNAKCTVTSQYSDLSATQTVTLTILTGTTAKRLPFAALLPFFAWPLWWIRRRGRPMLSALPVVLALCVLATVGGCGSGRRLLDAGDGGSSGSTGSSGVTTPSGTYNITASATAAGVTHTVPLTLIVK